MERHRAGKTIWVLQRVVAVIPRASVLSHIEPVRIVRLWRYRALRDPVHSIHLHSMKLSDTMPMNSCPIELEIICDCHFQLITPACLDPGSWILSIERLAAGLKVSVGVDRHLASSEAVPPFDTSGRFLIVIGEYIEQLV